MKDRTEAPTLHAPDRIAIGGNEDELPSVHCNRERRGGMIEPSCRQCRDADGFEPARACPARGDGANEQSRAETACRWASAEIP